MSGRRILLFFLVLLVLSLTSCSLNPIDRKIKEIQNSSEVQTHTFTEKVLLFMGLYEPQPPSGSNPSFLIRNSSGSNVLEIDHDGRGYIRYNFTIGKKLSFNDTMNADCPKIYVNSSGCLITESCSGSKIAVCD